MVLTKFEIWREIESGSSSTRSSHVRGMIPGLGPSYRSESLCPDPADYRDSLKITNLDLQNMSVAGMDLRVGEVYEANTLLATIGGLPHLRELEKDGIIKLVSPDSEGRITLKHDKGGKKVYFCTTYERIHLPEELSLRVDAKSTTGRLGVMCTNMGHPSWNRGLHPHPLIFAVQPYAFDVIVTPEKSKLIQAIIRRHASPFMTHEEIMSDRAIGVSRRQEKYDLSRLLQEDGLQLTYDTSLVLQGKERTQPIDLDAKPNTYDGRDFFEIINSKKGAELKPCRFYLLRTQEVLELGNVCGILSRENKQTGTGLWGHFAGFVWPGFAGPLTMECRSESGITINMGDPAAFVNFDKLARKMGEKEGYQGSYQTTNPLTPKMFKPME